jgi:amylosucrase
MGDELALGSDPGWAADPQHAHDNRWMHRPPMDWAAAARRHDQGSLEGRVFGAISRLARARRSLLALRAGGSTEVLPAGHRSVLAYRRAHPRSAPFLSLTNFSDVTQSADAGILAQAGLYQPVHVHSTAGRLDLAGGRIELPPWGFAWLSGA